MASRTCKRGHTFDKVEGVRQCPTCNKMLQKIWRSKPENAAAIRARATKWQQDPANKDRVLARTQRWDKKNPDKKRSYVLKRRANIAQRTPSWADLKAIRLFYKNCPKGYEVDHIIPIQGSGVSGLHVLWNLQYLTKAQNRAKGRTYVQTK